MGGKRIKLSSSERSELILRLLREEATAGQLAREVGISEATLYQWRETFIQAGCSSFTRCRESEMESRGWERKVAQRDQLIGELTVANRILKKSIGVSE